MASVLNNIAKRLNAQAKNLMKTNVFYSTSSFESAASHAAATTQFGAEYNPDVVQTAATNFMHSLSDMNSLETHFMKLARNYILESNKKKWICIEKQGNDAKASLEGRNVNVEQVRSIKKMIKQPHSQTNHGAVIELILTKDGNTLPGLMYEGSLSPSTYVFQGLGVIRTGDRNYYKGEFQHGTFNGKGVRIITGDKFQGTFVNGKLHGYGMVYFKDGTILQGQFVNGMLDGTVSIQLSSGMTLELRFRKGETNLEQECLKMYREDLEYNLRSLKRAAAPELMHLKV